MQRALRILLFPFSLMYCLATSIRNALYNSGIKKSTPYPVPLISVGNLTVGGTGKTPLTELLIKTLIPDYPCALLSRGYGRKTKGPLHANDDATASTIGDEPMQMKQKFPALTVMVAERRILGMNHLLHLNPPPKVVLLDDAYQHRAVSPGLSILVTDYFRPIYKDFCLPSGNLREPLCGKKRADIIIVNKCPCNLSETEKTQILRKLKPTAHQLVFFSSIGYDKLKPLKDTDTLPESAQGKKSVLAITGIGNPAPFFNEVAGFAKEFEKISFPDHHDFSDSDLRKINNKLAKMSPDSIVVTTEKDAVRLRHKNLPADLSEKIWYLPIELKILFNEQDTFLKTVKNYVEENSGNSNVS
ncbi:tetraacyldisaccharide 4'-kinase [Marinilabilia salmonicolor]|uniref:tetraacyldisaccharide 4'-kinase n=1 Tax=Marinilabilia salmonicolor TaxID=989 RepID=UPI00029B0984|nr:tetraacyldisaccharide 4'-kinase [Marinilabilia salmonicolor]